MIRRIRHIALCAVLVFALMCAAFGAFLTAALAVYNAGAHVHVSAVVGTLAALGMSVAVCGRMNVDDLL